MVCFYAIAALADPVADTVASYSPAPEAVPADPFSWLASPIALPTGAVGAIELTLQIPDGYWVWRDSVAIEVTDPAGLDIGPPSMPEGALSEEGRARFESTVTISLPVKAPSGPSRIANVSLQVQQHGCRAALCYPTRAEALDIPIQVTAP